MLFLKVGARSAPRSRNPESMLVRPETWEPYPDPESLLVLAFFSLHGSELYPGSGIGPMSSPEQGTDLFRIKPTRCSSDEPGKNGSFQSAGSFPIRSPS